MIVVECECDDANGPGDPSGVYVLMDTASAFVLRYDRPYNSLPIYTRVTSSNTFMLVPQDYTGDGYKWVLRRLEWPGFDEDLGRYIDPRKAPVWGFDPLVNLVAESPPVPSLVELADLFVLNSNTQRYFRGPGITNVKVTVSDFVTNDLPAETLDPASRHHDEDSLFLCNPLPYSTPQYHYGRMQRRALAIP